jgi:hypothetical protein
METITRYHIQQRVPTFDCPSGKLVDIAVDDIQTAFAKWEEIKSRRNGLGEFRLISQMYELPTFKSLGYTVIEAVWPD